MTRAEFISWFFLGLIAITVILAIVASIAMTPPAEASAATMATSTQYPVKAICRKCQRPPAPS